MDRRMFVKAAASGLLGAGIAPSAQVAARSQYPFFKRHSLPLGLQLYTVDAQLSADFDGTLARVARMGYRQVELAGLHGRTAQQVRSALDRVGLACRSVHVMAQPFGAGPNLSDNLATVIADAKTLGITDIVMPLFLMPKGFQPPASADPVTLIRAAGMALTSDDYHRIADFLNVKGKALAANGLRIGYHNHNFEFAPIAGTSGFDILLANTDPAIVSFELDIGWVAAAGVDPIALLRANGNRFTQLHVKDIKASTLSNFEFRQDPVEVGSGKIAWRNILPVAYAAGVRRFFVEQEPPFAGSPLDSIAKSIAFLQCV